MKCTPQTNRWRRDVNREAIPKLFEWMNDELDMLAARVPAARGKLRLFLSPSQAGRRPSVELFTEKLIIRFLLKPGTVVGSILAPQYRRFDFSEVDRVDWKYRHDAAAPKLYRGVFGYRKDLTAEDVTALEFIDRLIDEAPEVIDDARAPMLHRFCFECARRKILAQEIHDAAGYLNTVACHPPLAEHEVFEIVAGAVDEARR